MLSLFTLDHQAPFLLRWFKLKIFFGICIRYVSAEVENHHQLLNNNLVIYAQTISKMYFNLEGAEIIFLFMDEK